MANSTPRISVQQLTKYYGQSLVLHSVDLDIAEHEVVCLIGASGSGKSTMLRCVGRLVPYDHGHIMLDGVDIESDAMEEAELRRRVGIVFQSYNLFPTMSVLDNVTLAPRKVHKTDRDEAESRAMELLELFEMKDFADSYPDRLSGGQLLDSGRIIEESPPEQLFSDPQQPRTREFLQRIIEAGRL